MNFDRLRMFAAVVRTGNLRRASELLHLSPAAVSKALKQLEREVGFALTRKSGRGIAITERGRELARQAAPILERMQDLTDSVRSLKPDRRSVRLGSFEVFSTYFLGAWTAHCAPDLDYTIHELVPGEIEQAIADGLVDLGLTYIPVPRPGVTHRVVWSITARVYGRPSYIKGKPFAELAFAIPVPPLHRNPTRMHGLDGWPDAEHPRTIKYRVGMMEAALELCRRGRAVACLPDFVVALHNRTVSPAHRLVPVRAQPKLPPQTVYLAHRTGEPPGSALITLERAIASIPT